jgi:hypothetical protein
LPRKQGSHEVTRVLLTATSGTAHQSDCSGSSSPPSAVAAELREACDEDVSEEAGIAAVRVEVWVEDGHLCADRTWSEGGRQLGQLGCAETAGVGADFTTDGGLVPTW